MSFFAYRFAQAVTILEDNYFAIVWFCVQEW